MTLEVRIEGRLARQWQTQYSRDVYGEAINNPQGQIAYETAPFFGCVFPDGYNIGEDKYGDYTWPLYNSSSDPLHLIPSNTTISPLECAF